MSHKATECPCVFIALSHLSEKRGKAFKLSPVITFCVSSYALNPLEGKDDPQVEGFLPKGLLWEEEAVILCIL